VEKRAAAVLVAALAVAALLPSPAFAQAGGVTNPFREIFNPEDFTNLIVGRIAGNRAITDWLLRIGVLLAAAFFLWNLYMGLVYQSPGAVTDALVRAAIVGTIFANLPFFAGVIVDFHRALGAIGGQVFSSLTDQQGFDTALTELNAVIQDAMTRMGQIDIWSLPRFFFTIITAVLILLLFVVFSILTFAIYNFLLFGSYVMLAVAVIMMPLSLACLATRSMQSFVYEWLQVVLHSSLVVMLTKAVAGIVVNIGVAQQIQNYANSIRAAMEQGSFEAMLAAMVGIQYVIPVAAMLLIGVFTLMNVQGVASAFVGRVESVAGALAGMYFAARAASGPLRSAARSVAAFSPTAAGAAVWQAAWSSPGRAREFLRSAGAAARERLHRIQSTLATIGGPARAWLAEITGFDSTLPRPMSPDMYQAIQEIQETTERWAREMQTASGVDDVVSVQMPLGLRHEGATLAADQPPTGGRIEPTEWDEPWEPIWQPDEPV